MLAVIGRDGFTTERPGAQRTEADRARMQAVVTEVDSHASESSTRVGDAPAHGPLP